MARDVYTPTVVTASPLPNDLPTALVEIKTLRARVAELEARMGELNAERDELVSDVAALRAERDQMIRRFFGKKSERLGTEQSLLFPSPAAPAQIPAESDEVAEEQVRPHRRRRRRRRRHPGRGCYPPDLPRDVVPVPTSPEMLVCPCGGRRHKVGVVCSERLDVVPAQFRIVELVRDKLACARCDAHTTPPLPPEPIKRGLPTARLLAHVVVSKFCDHLPLNRQEEIYARQRVELSRSTMSGWCLEVAELFVPVVLVVVRRVLAGPRAQTDETTLPVLAPKACRKERLWIVRGAEKGDVFFVHTRSKHKEQPQAFLQGFRGTLQADAYKGFDALFSTGDVLEAGCWAHTRRYWVDAAQVAEGKSPQAEYALLQIGRLYEVERRLKDEAEEAQRPLDPARRLMVRMAISAPIVDTLFVWAREERKRALPKSPVGKALGYMLNQEVALRRFLEDGALEIDNNDAERGLRQAVTGRKNYLFAGSDAGAAAAAIHYSLVVSCKELGADPLEYYTDVLPRLAVPLTREQLVALTPRDWFAARQRARPAEVGAKPGSEVPPQIGPSPRGHDTG